MNIRIMNAEMNHSKEDGYVGKVEFEVENHKRPYEMTLHSKNAKEWMYSLHFLNESGSEEEILSVEDYLEESDEGFDQLVDAAKSKLLKHS